MDFEVIEVLWHGKIYKFDDYVEALDYAKIMTYGEEKYDSAMIISIKKDNTARVDGVHWIVDSIFLVEKLAF